MTGERTDDSTQGYTGRKKFSYRAEFEYDLYNSITKPGWGKHREWFLGRVHEFIKRDNVDGDE